MNFDLSRLERATALIECDSEDFRELITRSGLDPGRHLRFWDWSNLNFAGSDLRGYDFSGAILRNCRFAGARIVGARFDKADLRGSNLREAADWKDYVREWEPSSNPPSDECLAIGAVFQDVAFGPEMVVIPAGKFLMGSPEDEPGRYENEGPQHEVTISKAFAVGCYPITREEWDQAYKVGGVRLETVPGNGRLPMCNVSWGDAKEYVTWLSKMTGHVYRLQTEAEWEYCCRAGMQTAYYFGDEIREDRANLNSNRTTEVGSFPANSFGLYDMHGNVWEWCEDDYRGYEAKAVTDPVGPRDKDRRVVRGGSWDYDARLARSADRYDGERVFGYGLIGFRCARDLS